MLSYKQKEYNNAKNINNINIFLHCFYNVPNKLSKNIFLKTLVS